DNDDLQEYLFNESNQESITKMLMRIHYQVKFNYQLGNANNDRHLEVKLD
ncbi:12348_t:CDS:1, partial [Entrophospora sp. SA101]